MRKPQRVWDAPCSFGSMRVLHATTSPWLLASAVFICPAISKPLCAVGKELVDDCYSRFFHNCTSELFRPAKKSS